MANHNQQTLESIRVVGSLLGNKVIQDARLYRMPGQQKQDYGIESGLSFNDELGRYWVIARSRWKEFQQLSQREDIDQQAVTVNDWLLPLLNRVLGYDVRVCQHLQQIGEREFPISHEAWQGAVPMVLCSSEQELDKGDNRFGQEGRRRSPMGLAQEHLNASSGSLWALVSNGLVLRLLRDNPAMTRPAYIEVDFARLFEEDNYADFATLWLLLHASRLTPHSQQPDQCWLEQWRKRGHDEGERALEKLRYGVADALRQLGTGFLAHPANTALRQKLTDNTLSTDAYFQQVLRLVYRLLFLLTAEDRDIALLPVQYEGQDYRQARALYQAGYSVSLLRERARQRRHRDHHGDGWQLLCIAFDGYAEGQPLLAQPALGGLFATDQCRDLLDCQLENGHLYSALFDLCYFNYQSVLVRINYRDMDTEEFGSVYESLLELMPQIHPEIRWRFSFIGDAKDEAAASGHSRKLSGSYYTPDSLVQELIKSALEPVLTERLQNNLQNPRDALLGITVCDPACGSGHFLLAAARRLAVELAQIDAGADQATEAHYRHALRDVVRRCIYGVDLNPMAVELCKTGLWLESIEPGKPLSFLDAHVQCGNSLVGSFNEIVLSEGIDNKAYAVKEGDEKNIAYELKLQNSLYAKRLHTTLRMPNEIFSAGFDDVEENSLVEVKGKEFSWRQYLSSGAYSEAKLVRDLAITPYFSQKTEFFRGVIPTNAHLDLLCSSGVSELPDKVRSYISDISVKFNFFHWDLNFPAVFSSGGFDLVIGNPPWDVVKNEDDSDGAQAEHDRLKNWYDFSFDIVKGKKDLYKFFLYLATRLVKVGGSVGLVIPVGVFIEDKTYSLRRYLLDGGEIINLSVYQNSKKGYFSAVHASTLFGVLSYCRRNSKFVRYSNILRYGAGQERIYFEGHASDLLNDDLTFPMFYEKSDHDMYRTLVAALRSMPQLEYDVVAEFHASTDKNKISVNQRLQSDWVLLKNDGIHQFNSNYGVPCGYISDENAISKIVAKGTQHVSKCASGFRLVYRDIARADDSRTLIACLLPDRYVSSYDIPMILPRRNLSLESLGFYLGYVNSLVFDFMIRPYVDKHVKGYVLGRAPMPVFDETSEIMIKISANALSLNKVSDGGYNQLRAEIDASVAILAKISADEFMSLVDSFKVLSRAGSAFGSMSDYYRAVCDIIEGH